MLNRIKNLFHQQETIPFQTKVTLLIVVGIVFLVVFLWSFYNQYIADTLVKYLPDNTVVYAHFNLPKLNQSDGFDETLTQILSQIGLADFNISDIKREIALVGILQDGQLVQAIIIRTDRPYRVKNFLATTGYNYKFLTSTKVVISSATDIVDNFVKDKNNQVLLKSRGKFSLINSLALYVSANFITQTQNVLLSLVGYDLFDSTGDLYLNARVKKDQTIVYSRLSKQKINLVNSSNHNLIFSAENLGQLFDNWQNDLQATSQSEYNLWQLFWQPLKEKYFISEALEKKILNAKILLLADKKAEDTDWLLGDYDYYLKLENINFTASDQEAIANTLKSIMAWQFPESVDLRLSDGMIISELRPNPESWEFIVDEQGYNNLIAPDLSTNFIYKLSDGILEIASDKKWFELAENYPDNYLTINTSFLLDDFWQYVKNFGFMEIE